jgi:membrane protein YdbS with pleckstrin-like domain
VDLAPAVDAPHLPDPSARTLWAITGALTGAVLAGLLGALAVIGGLWPLAVVLVAVGAGGGALYGRAAWRRRTWHLAPRALELRRGVVVHRATTIPFERIQQIDIERGPLERLIGLSQLVVRTAAATTDAHLYGLAPHDADRLREQLIELAGIDDVI